MITLLASRRCQFSIALEWLFSKFQDSGFLALRGKSVVPRRKNAKVEC